MKKHRHVGTGLTAGAFFLIGTLAVAQTSQSKTAQPREASSGQAAGMAVDHAGGNGVRRAYTDTSKSDNNPLYEGKGQANLKPAAGASAAQYKDPEDMTARYRPGNNKTTRNANDTAAQGAGAAQPQAMPRKHIAGVKYEDRIAGDNTGGANVQGTTAGQSAQGDAQRKSGSIIVLDREAQSGQASGNLQRKDGAIIHADFPRSMNARNSAHATESVSPSNNAKQGENPLHEDSGKSGTNPLYESGKSAVVKPNAAGTHTQGEETKFKQEFGPVQANKKSTAIEHNGAQPSNGSAPASTGKTSKVDSFSIKQ